MKNAFKPEVTQPIIDLLKDTYSKLITPEYLAQAWLRKCQLKFAERYFDNYGLPEIKHEPKQLELFLERLLKALENPLAACLYLRDGFVASYLQEDSEFMRHAQSLVSMDLSEVIAMDYQGAKIAIRSAMNAEEKELFHRVIELTDLTFYVLPETGKKTPIKLVSVRRQDVINKAKATWDYINSDDGGDWYHC